MVSFSGELFTCGVGKYGRLGLGSQVPAYTPTLLTYYHRRNILLPSAVSTGANLLTTEVEMCVRVATNRKISGGPKFRYEVEKSGPH